MHIDNIDYNTHCKTLSGCLSDVKQWYALAQPAQLPILQRT